MGTASAQLSSRRRKRQEGTMDARRLRGMWAILLLSAATVATAAEPDLRLVTAAAQQDKTAIRALLKEGVDVNSARADGVTPLLWAAHWGDLDTIDLLLRAGAKVNAA